MADDTKIENRVFLFKDLAAAFIADHGDLLASPDEDDRDRAIAALADIARVCAVMADSAHLSPDELMDAMLGEDDDEDVDEDEDEDEDA